MSTESQVTGLDDEPAKTETVAEPTPKPAKAQKPAKAPVAKVAVTETVADATAVDEPVALEDKVLAGGSSADLSGERVTIIVAKGEGDLGSLQVDVTVNGTKYQLPRDVPCNVPVELLGVLDDAVLTTYSSTGEPSHRKRFPYNIVR